MSDEECARSRCIALEVEVPQAKPAALCPLCHKGQGQIVLFRDCIPLRETGQQRTHCRRSSRQASGRGAGSGRGADSLVCFKFSVDGGQKCLPHLYSTTHAKLGSFSCSGSCSRTFRERWR